MLKKLLRSLAACGVAALIAGSAHAQYIGPGEMKPAATVAEIKANPLDGREVLLQGKLTKKYGKKFYEFVDKTGNVRAKIDSDVFFALPNKVCPDTVLEVYGEIKQRAGVPVEIEAQRLFIIKQDKQPAKKSAK